MSDYLSLIQLGAAVNRTPQTIRLHIRKGWLPAEKIPGANGWRVRRQAAQKWASRYLATTLH